MTGKIKPGIKYKKVSKQVTLSAGARGTDGISFTLPDGAVPICAVPSLSPNAAFVMIGPYILQNDRVGFGYHNEATVQITGAFEFVILYQ